VGFVRFPSSGHFNEDTGDKPFPRLLAGKEANNTGVFLDLAVDVFATTGDPQTLSLGSMEGEEGKAIWGPSARAATLGCVSELVLTKSLDNVSNRSHIWVEVGATRKEHQR
jgi:hypothetical protein